jgi:hypothetical protein
MFRPGTAEVIAGRSIASRFQGAGLGETLRFASADWTVVGIFDAGRTGFDSEIWGDSEQMMQAFRRLAFLGARTAARGHRALRRGEAEIESDPRLTLEAKRETRFYADQSEMLSKFISYLGTTDLGDLLDRRGDRRDDHDVSRASPRARRRSARCGRWASRAPRSSSRSWPRRCCWGRSAASSGSSRVVHAGARDLDDELPDVRRARVHLHD